MKDPYALSIEIAIALSKDLLTKDNSVGIYHRYIQSLAIELFKVKENLSNTMSDIFPTRVLNYNLTSQTDFGFI